MSTPRRPRSASASPKEPIDPEVFIPAYLKMEHEEEHEEFDLTKLSPEAQKMYIIDMFCKKRM